MTEAPRPEERNRATVRAYLEALSSRCSGEALTAFFTPDAVLEDHPSAMSPACRRSDLATIRRRVEEGRRLMASELYELRSEVAEGSRVAVEARWTGTLAVPLGARPAGSRMRAYLSIHFELRDGRIAVQRNYDCFEP